MEKRKVISYNTWRRLTALVISTDAYKPTSVIFSPLQPVQWWVQWNMNKSYSCKHLSHQFCSCLSHAVESGEKSGRMAEHNAIDMKRHVNHRHQLLLTLLDQVRWNDRRQTHLENRTFAWVNCLKDVETGASNTWEMIAKHQADTNK